VAQTEGFRRTVLEQGPDVLDLLLSSTPTPVLEDYVGELIQRASSVAPARPPPVTSLVDPLSKREVIVLRYLCSRLTHQEIASALYISQNTLKSHLKSVYRKLGVASRHEAVEVGRELRIV
jgi:LuxR family maltose regulon positive regulatory protein